MAVPRTPPAITTQELANVVVMLIVIGEVEPVLVLFSAPRLCTPEYSTKSQLFLLRPLHEVVNVVAPAFTLGATHMKVMPVAPELATLPMAV